MDYNADMLSTMKAFHSAFEQHNTSLTLIATRLETITKNSGGEGNCVCTRKQKHPEVIDRTSGSSYVQILASTPSMKLGKKACTPSPVEKGKGVSLDTTP
ncbi:uncharacterized protein G2W53_018083 [Senna tora]|uniref:Uncharacterized protein n=1 Tax=Senna tora TaxID=362788 RepID=A0A834TZW3_9FABA|nr:uncharacterized protein G2W53_018083 [Senna tora]